MQRRGRGVEEERERRGRKGAEEGRKGGRGGERRRGPPESAVALAHADAAQHSLLVGHVLAQELADDVPAQTEAHHDQLRLGVGALDVAHHGRKFPGAT